ILRRRTVHATLYAISESLTPYFHRRWLGNFHWEDTCLSNQSFTSKLSKMYSSFRLYVPATRHNM
ncbi:hypothetical protein EV363DRAFT_1195251, partial [Boletus edulis]